MGILESTEVSASEDLNALEKGTTSVHDVENIKWEGRSSDYAVLEIKREIPFSPLVFARVTEVRHIYKLKVECN